MSADLPGIEAPPETVVNAVRAWYVNNKAEYDTVWPRLDEIRETWDSMGHLDRAGLLKGSYVFTVYTQQTRTHLAEAAFRSLINSDTILESRTERIDGDIPGKQNQMQAWIFDSFAMSGVWDSAVNLISMDDASGAQNLLMDNVKGLRAAKSGFVLANLGFVQKMCTDSNVLGLVSGDKEDVADMDAKMYDDYCTDVLSFFPQLREELPPYHLQWVLFDFARQHIINDGEVRLSPVVEAPGPATHDVWFSNAIGNPGLIVNKMRSITETAHRIRQVINTDPAYLDDDGEPKYRDMTQLMHWANEGNDEVAVVVDKAMDMREGTADAGVAADVRSSIEEQSGVDDDVRSAIQKAIDQGRVTEEVEAEIEAAVGD